jgi:proteasome lid subunit RPN8/RPN11
MIQFIDEIEKHFEEWYPKEGCGVLAAIKGEMQWFPCKNVATDEDDFVIDSEEYIRVGQRGDIVAVVHSHPDESPEPSELDRKYCNATGLKYYIFSYPEMELFTLNPDKQSKPLYGRDYEFGVNDCFEAARDYYISKGLEIPRRPLFEDDWWEKGLDYFTEDYIKTWGFKKVDGILQKGDLLIFTIRANIGNHCGVYLGDDIFYHHAENRLSCRESIYPFWKRHISGVYRYAA